MAGSGRDPRSLLRARPQRCKAKLKRRQPGPGGGAGAAGRQRAAGRRVGRRVPHAMDNTTEHTRPADLSDRHLRGRQEGRGLRWCHREAVGREDLLCGRELENLGRRCCNMTGGTAAESPRGGQGQDRGEEGSQGRWRLSGAKEVRGQGPGAPEVNLLGVPGPGSARRVGDHWEEGCMWLAASGCTSPPSPSLHTDGFGVLDHLPAGHRGGQHAWQV